MTDKIKRLKSKNYNYIFNYKTGFFARWGEGISDDPQFAPSPEILDIEISSICHGINNKLCSFCYKSNNPNGKFMKYDTFKNIFQKFPQNLTQIAFGVGDIESNPDLIKIFDLCLFNSNNKVIPNITINGFGLTDEYADYLSKYCGSIALSKYDDFYFYNAIEKLLSKNAKQINAHILISEESFDECINFVETYSKNDSSKKLNALVFLLLKPKGRGINYKSIIDIKKYDELINKAFENKINIGFDSCFTPIFLEIIKNRDDFEILSKFTESCEASLFSGYINVDGKFYPCSFLEDENIFNGIDMVNCHDFINDIWYNESVLKFRNSLLNQKTCSKLCPHYKIYDCLKGNINEN